MEKTTPQKKEIGTKDDDIIRVEQRL